MSQERPLRETGVRGLFRGHRCKPADCQGRAGVALQGISARAEQAGSAGLCEGGEAGTAGKSGDLEPEKHRTMGISEACAAVKLLHGVNFDI